VLKITDFGTAEQFDRYSGGTMLCNTFSGTHHFIAPEVIADDGENGYDGTKGMQINKTVDIWAAGVCLYYMLYGKLPFEYNEDPNVMELHEKILKGSFEFPREADVSSSNLIRSTA
jgi:serine/threonine protein kinase